MHLNAKFIEMCSFSQFQTMRTDKQAHISTIFFFFFFTKSNFKGYGDLRSISYTSTLFYSNDNRFLFSSYLVGGDGNLYEGRGWRRKGEDYSAKAIGPIAEALNKNYVEVAIIGRTCKGLLYNSICYTELLVLWTMNILKQL